MGLASPCLICSAHQHLPEAPWGLQGVSVNSLWALASGPWAGGRGSSEPVCGDAAEGLTRPKCLIKLWRWPALAGRPQSHSLNLQLLSVAPRALEPT